MNALEVRHLTKHYGATPALCDLDLTLAPGRIVGLMGDNGAGKTTLLKILAGVLADWEGSVTVAGCTPGPDSKAVVSYLPDTSFLPDRFTCSDAIGMCADFFADFDAARATALIASLGVDASRKLKTLSKGQREKVQLALAMSRQAKVYLLDEPISGVDPAAREVLLQAIIRDLSPEALVLVSTHLIHDLEPILDGVAFMRHGRILLTGEVDDLRSERGLSIDALFREVYR